MRSQDVGRDSNKGDTVSSTQSPRKTKGAMRPARAPKGSKELRSLVSDELKGFIPQSNVGTKSRSNRFSGNMAESPSPSPEREAILDDLEEFYRTVGPPGRGLSAADREKLTDDELKALATRTPRERAVRFLDDMIETSSWDVEKSPRKRAASDISKLTLGPRTPEATALLDAVDEAGSEDLSSAADDDSDPVVTPHARRRQSRDKERLVGKSRESLLSDAYDSEEVVVRLPSSTQDNGSQQRPVAASVPGSEAARRRRGLSKKT